MRAGVDRGPAAAATDYAPQSLVCRHGGTLPAACISLDRIRVDADCCRDLVAAELAAALLSRALPHGVDCGEFCQLGFDAKRRHCGCAGRRSVVRLAGSGEPPPPHYA